MMERPALGIARKHVEIRDYDPRWPALFDVEHARLLAALAPAVTEVEHVGSTAVPGLAAKPIIDMLVGVPALPPSPALRSALEALGYEHRGELVPGQVTFALGPPSCRTHLLHACIVDSANWRHKIVFRDHLRGQREDAVRYAALKRRLAARYPDLRDEYTEAKSDLVREILVRASAARPATRAVPGAAPGLD